MRATLQFDGEDELRAWLDGFRSRLADCSPAFESIQDHFEAYEDLVFEEEGRGTRWGQWRRLSEPYAAWKALRAPGMPILDLTGHLRASLSEPNAPDAIRRIGPREVEFGTSDPKAAAHQEGRGFLPTRPVLDPRNREYDLWFSTVVDHLVPGVV